MLTQRGVLTQPLNNPWLAASLPSPPKLLAEGSLVPRKCSINLTWAMSGLFLAWPLGRGVSPWGPLRLVPGAGGVVQGAGDVLSGV